MYCPLKFVSSTMGKTGIPVGECECEREKCAWWYERADNVAGCAVTVLAKQTETLQVDIGEQPH